MTTRPCHVCGNLFDGNTSAKYCTPECRRQGYTTKTQAYLTRTVDTRRISNRPSRARYRARKLADDPLYDKKNYTWTTYRLTWDAFLELRGDGTCNSCGETANRMCVDHDHSCCPGSRSCGRCVRGYLCDDCNRALGSLRDSPERIERLLAYVQSR